MDNIKDGLINTIGLGKSILQEYKEGPDKQKIYPALVSLLYIEGVLDLGRILLDMPDSQTLAEINKGLNEIRDGIFLLMKPLDKEELKSTLFSVGEKMKINFVSLLE
jgi:hypothetical protein